MKKILLLVFSAALFIFGFQTESKTQVNSRQITQSTGASRAPFRFEALGSYKLEKMAAPVTEARLRAASEKALKLIQSSQSEWSKKETCTSCHHQLLPEIPIGLARKLEVSIDETAARNTTSASFAFLKDLDGMVQGYDYIDILFDGWALVAAHAAGVSPSLSTTASAQFIASRQLSDGSWPTIDDRPPQSHSRFSTTAVCAGALAYYMPERLKAEKEARLRQAREWLLKTQPRTTEDMTFQLLGLDWTGAGEAARKNAARQLLARQRADGGWSQLPGLASDAYSTGEALFALHTGAGLSTTDSAYQRGLRFLLQSQEQDGSWHVKSRLNPPAPVSPPYFETGFPYQHDQFISAMGTSWGVAALLYAMPERAGKSLTQPSSINLAPDENARWIEIALSGSAADLKKLLDEGVSPNSKTAKGTTALMLAARDPEKVKLLIERGADVNARAESGIDALTVAARHKGNYQSVRLLLAKGARPNKDKAVEVLNDASAIFFAITSGDVQTVGALLDAGAKIDEQMRLIGRIEVTPIFYAVSAGDSEMVNYLIERGANPNEADDAGISLLGWATINNHLDVTKVLVRRGAQVNHVDSFGMTPLLYAASIDFGESRVMKALIDAGADLKAKNKQGFMALDLAKNYHHSEMASLLTTKSTSR